MKIRKKIIIPFVISALLWIPSSVYSQDYIVKNGDSLFTVSKEYNISIDNLKLINNLDNDIIYAGQVLDVDFDLLGYTVKSGDSLWKLAQSLDLDVNTIKNINNLTSDNIYIGQKLKLSASYGHVVESGDSLWIIANKYGTTIQSIKDFNGLLDNEILIGQVLFIPKANTTNTTTNTPTTTSDTEQNSEDVTTNATQFYTVKYGDSVSSIASKFGISTVDIIKYNYLSDNEWLNTGQIIAVNGYAERDYTVSPGEDNEPLMIGSLVDWYREGQHLINRNDILTITDVETGNSFKVKMIGGYNHIDIETISSMDTQIMYDTFNNNWKWSPRAVVIYKDGMNIAASLSGMPHSFDLISGNDMNGHCDLYLYNSNPHGSSVSEAYVEQHKQMVLKASGQ